MTSSCAHDLHFEEGEDYDYLGYNIGHCWLFVYDCDEHSSCAVVVIVVDVVVFDDVVVVALLVVADLIVSSCGKKMFI